MPTLDLTDAYTRSAYPALGIPLARAMAEPALRTTLELLDRVHAESLRRARRTGAGIRIERTAN